MSAHCRLDKGGLGLTQRRLANALLFDLVGRYSIGSSVWRIRRPSMGTSTNTWLIKTNTGDYVVRRVSHDKDALNLKLEHNVSPLPK